MCSARPPASVFGCGVVTFCPTYRWGTNGQWSKSIQRGLLTGIRRHLPHHSLCPLDQADPGTISCRSKSMTYAPRYPIARYPKTEQPDEIAQALSFALRHHGRKRVHHVDEMMAKITAERLVKHLEASGFVLM
jgi:hypothetical protein